MSTTKESAVIIEQVAVPAKDSLQPKILYSQVPVPAKDSS